MSEMERRSADTRMAERDAARTNPEVMGRSEPQPMTAPSATDGRPEMSDIHTRFDQLQSEFIEDPKGAVQKVERLIDDLFSNMRERAQTIHRDIEKNGDTEHLRLAMRSYREMIDSLGNRRVA
jgi:hypothetical protein